MKSSRRRARMARATLAVLVGFVPAGSSAWARGSAVSAVPSSVYAPADSLEGNFLSAYIAGASRDTSAAAVFYREALRDDPRNPELLERAFLALLADGDLNAAAKTADRVVARNPGNALAQLTLGVQAFKAKQYGAARAYLAKGGRGRAADLTATLLTAWAWAGSKNGRQALEVAGGIKGERGFAVFRDYHAGLIATVVGNDAEAERRLKAAYDGDKTTLRVVQSYGRFLARHGRTDEAIQVLKGYEAVSPRHPVIKADLDDVMAGKTLAPLVANAADGAAELLYGLGSAGMQQGDELASIVYLRLALQLNPDHALALITLADTYERLHRTDQAMEILQRIPAGSPLRPSADIQVALSQEQLGKSDEAVATLDRLKKQRPDDNDVTIALGNVLRAQKKYAESADIYGQAIDRAAKDDPTLWTLYYYRGTAYERAKDWTRSEADLKKALDLVPESQPIGRSQVLNYLGYSWVDRNTNLDEAFKMLKRAVELNPRDGMIIDSLGWSYFRFGRYDEAVRELEKAVEVKAGDPVINDHLGDAYWRSGRKLEAKFQWQHAKDSDPEPDDLKKIDIKLESGLPDDEKPAEAKGSSVEPAKDGG